VISKREVEDEERIARIDSDVAAKEEQRRLEREKLSEKIEGTEHQDDSTRAEEAEKIQDENREGAAADYEDDDNDDDDILAALDGRQNP
jgi:hypothetical protein